MNWIQRFIVKLFKIRQANDRKITITEPLSFHGNVLKNQIWYRGDPVELEQYFKAIAQYDVEKARFWACVPENKVRKTHSGIVQVVIDRLSDIVLADMNDVDFNEVDANGKPLQEQPIKALWDEIAKDNELDTLLDEAITGALSSGDGAFKISIDPLLKYPVLEFYTADNVEFVRKRRRLHEILFYTTYVKDGKEYRLCETYGKGYVTYKLYSDDGKEVTLGMLEETASLVDVTFYGNFIMGVPLIFFASNKWKGRGKALFDSKTDNLDSLDEIISQWADAVRSGRIKRYIPEDLCPRDPESGEILPSNPFDNQFTVVGSSMAEKETQKIDVSQPVINYEAYVNSYSNFLDLCLQGIISPSTLGIDLKKTDNAESQREKEKITIHTRNKITKVLNKVIPSLAVIVMKVYDTMVNKLPDEYEASVSFGEYGAPGFENVVETVGKAKSYGVMSTEKCIDELYGDTMTEEEKATEVARIKEEQSAGIEPRIPEDDIEDEDTGGDE